MGVPKFYRWISERYPCLSQIVREHQIPEFDNLYLDMNGIIHICSHPNDDDVHFRISEEKIFTAIFHYIEVLFDIIKPRKVFFMAVDGVAPRAKMNQQRSRRFRSAKEAAELVKKALQRGETLPEEDRFDSNCITPGTGFMARLQEQLKYFVNKKLTTDGEWRKVNVILSGHDVPGEGEHKIMDYVRWARVQEDYDPNTRHCLYGLDADLMMLGLTSHEPHFSLLREEVKFGGGKKAKRRISTPEETTFHLLHLSLMREYIDHEFSVVKPKLPFGYDLENIIDDWVLMGFLVGNDFIPHLPDMHINHDALPYLYQTYIEVLPHLGGYLNEGGFLNLERFEVYLKTLSKFDFEQFDAKWTDLRLLDEKRGRFRKKKKQKMAKPKAKGPVPLEQFNVYSLFGGHEGDAGEEELKAVAMATESEPDDDEDEDEIDDEPGDSLMEGMPEDFTDRGKLFLTEFQQHKKEYYREKLGFDDIDSGAMREQSKTYVVAIQWILHYYFNGVPSWSWFYPYHYAPFLSDIRDISNLKIDFNLAKPFRPFQQLLAVLPAASKQFLPEAYQGLMVNEDSLLLDFYPHNFKTDMNGKTQEWEAVVLIPFIDEDRLICAMEPLESRLTKDEQHRNSVGLCLSYRFDQDTQFNCKATYPGFPDVTNCKSKCTKLPIDTFSLSPDKVRRGVCPGVKQDVFFPGFPTLKFLKYKARLQKADVRVFQMHSKNDSVIINLENASHDAAVVAKQLVGKTCHIKWPHLVEAFVFSVQTAETIYDLGLNGHGMQSHPQTEKSVKEWKKGARHLTVLYAERFGIELGPVRILLKASTLIGKKYAHNAKLNKVEVQKEWDVEQEFHPYQLCVQDINVHAKKDSDTIESLEQLFPVGSDCFVLSKQYYGSMAKVKSVDKQKQRIQVKASIVSEPDLEEIKWNNFPDDDYRSSGNIAYQLRLHPLVLSRMTSGLKVEAEKKKPTSQPQLFNIGLNIKNGKKKEELMGYVRRYGEQWTYSYKAFELVAEYIETFPDLFAALDAIPEVDVYTEDQLFPRNPNGLSDVLSWLRSLPTHKASLVACGSQSTDEVAIEAVEKVVEMHKKQTKGFKPKQIVMNVKPNVLYTPSQSLDRLPPDPFASYELFDRVVYTRFGGAVPFGLHGTVIAIYGNLFDVVFDEPFLGGMTLNCSKNQGYKVGPSSLINISYGQRQFSQPQSFGRSQRRQPQPQPSPAQVERKPAQKQKTGSQVIRIKKRPSGEESEKKPVHKTEEKEEEEEKAELDVPKETLQEEEVLVDLTETWVHVDDESLEPDMAAAIQGLSDLQMNTSSSQGHEMEDSSLALKKLLNIPPSVPQSVPFAQQVPPPLPHAFLRPNLFQQPGWNTMAAQRQPLLMPPPLPPPLLSNYSRLFSWCAQNRFPQPKLHFTVTSYGISCTADILGHRFTGALARSEQEAADSVSKFAIERLGLPLHPLGVFGLLPPPPGPVPPFTPAGVPYPYFPAPGLPPVPVPAPSNPAFQHPMHFSPGQLPSHGPVLIDGRTMVSATSPSKSRKEFVPLQVMRRNPVNYEGASK
eukprot:m.12490 g.12490  ORF g.12490 m.12490 type:complete len:1544 (+) comp24099_c0_seq1:68-4699(+)